MSASSKRTGFREKKAPFGDYVGRGGQGGSKGD